MTCPSCGVENPPSAQYCDCGYEFAPGTKPKGSAPAQPQGTQKNTSSAALAGCLGLMGAIVLTGVFNIVNSDKSTSASRPAYTPPPESPALKVSIKKWNWMKGGFGGIMIATFTIRSDNPYSVKDLGIECELSGKSGTVIDSIAQTIYDIIPANSTKAFPEVNMGFIRAQTAGAECKVVSARLLGAFD